MKYQDKIRIFRQKQKNQDTSKKSRKSQESNATTRSGIYQIFSMQEDEIGEVSNPLQENVVSQSLAQSIKKSDSVSLKNDSKSTTTSPSPITIINVATENIKHSSRE